MPRRSARFVVWTFAISTGAVLAIVAAVPRDPPAAEAATPSEGSPLAALEAPRAAQWQGVVERRLPAGSYTYLAVRDDAHAVRWVATTGKGVNEGSVVAVNSWGVRTDFYSRRLDRSFAELEFGSVEPVASEGAK